MSKTRYMWIDLGLFAAILTVLEAVNRLALSFFPGEAFTLSIVIPVVAIVLMRWGAYGLMHAALGGAVYAVLNGGSAAVVLAYALGNLLAAGNLLWFRFVDKAAIRASAWRTIAFAATCYILMNVGRAVFAALLTDAAFFETLSRYLATDALSGVVGAVAVLVARRQNGVFEDQNAYLYRLAAEEEKQHAKAAA